MPNSQINPVQPPNTGPKNATPEQAWRVWWDVSYVTALLIMAFCAWLVFPPEWNAFERIWGGLWVGGFVLLFMGIIAWTAVLIHKIISAIFRLFGRIGRWIINKFK